MISVTELRNGTIFEDQGTLLQVLSYEHIKMGRGSANIKVKVRNVRTGSVTDKSFMNGARVNDVSVIKKDLQFLYKDDDFAYFMDPATYEQIQISLPVISDEQIYLKDGMNFVVSFLGTEALSIILPPKMEFAVTETGPSLRGNSTSNIYKDAILENGLKTKVPLFVSEGDRIKVDTRTGSYSEKA